MKLQLACDECANGTEWLDPVEGTCLACGQFPGQLVVAGLGEGEQ